MLKITKLRCATCFRSGGTSADDAAVVGHHRRLRKKMSALAIKTHPSPTPGSKASGAEKLERDYFKMCVAKDGKVEN